nr:MAG TPA: Limb expression 1 [Caudoviricetes sp.]
MHAFRLGKLRRIKKKQKREPPRGRGSLFFTCYIKLPGGSCSALYRLYSLIF